MRLQGRRIVVTGAAGFIGRHTVAALRAEGADVQSYSRHGRPPPWLCLPLDLLDADAVRDAVETARPHHLVHLGGAIGRPGLSLADLLVVNAAGTETVLAAAAGTAGLETVVVASSSAVYDRRAPLPLVETAAVAPSAPYGLSKAAQELVAASWRHRSDVQVVVVRLFNVIGPGQSPDLAFSAFARQVAAAEQGDNASISVGRLDARRDYVDVRDVARAITTLVDTQPRYDEYNVCTGTGRSTQEGLDVLLGLARRSVEVVTDAARIRRDDVPAQIGDSTRLRSETGWSPEVPFERTLADLLEHWRQEPETP